MDNLNNLIYTGSYAGQYEFIKACNICKINICVYNLDNISSDKNTFVYNYETIISVQENYNDYNPYNPTLLLGWANSNHYELLIPLDTDADIPIEYQIKNNNQNSIKSPNKIPRDINIELSHKDNDNTSKKINKENDVITLSDKYKFELTILLKISIKISCIKRIY